MEFAELVKKRRSIRKFNDKPVELDKLVKVIDSAQLAPSAMNQQSWYFVLVSNLDIIEDLSMLMENTNNAFYGAKNVILLFYKEDNIAPVVDTTFATSYMMFEACELGLGTCWINGVKHVLNDSKYQLLKEKMGVPKEYKCLGSLAIGYYDLDKVEILPRKKDYFTIIK